MIQEKRVRRRVNVGFPVRVSGTAPSGESFDEMSHTINVSSAAVKLAMKSEVQKGDVVTITLPLPKEMRPVQTLEYAYTSRGVISRIESAPAEPSMKVVVVKFTK